MPLTRPDGLGFRIELVREAPAKLAERPQLRDCAAAPILAQYIAAVDVPYST